MEGGPKTELNKLGEEEVEEEGFGPKRSAMVELPDEEDDPPTCFDDEFFAMIFFFLILYKFMKGTNKS